MLANAVTTQQGRPSTGTTTGRLVREESGVMAVVFALIIVVLIGLAAFAIDIARWYVEGQKVQRTVDAAALAGATYPPTDLTAARVSARRFDH